MDEKSSATLENILQAAMEEFSDKGFSGRIPTSDRKKGRRDHRCLLWIFFQQRGFV